MSVLTSRTIVPEPVSTFQTLQSCQNSNCLHGAMRGCVFGDFRSKIIFSDRVVLQNPNVCKLRCSGSEKYCFVDSNKLDWKCDCQKTYILKKAKHCKSVNIMERINELDTNLSIPFQYRQGILIMKEGTILRPDFFRKNFIAPRFLDSIMQEGFQKLFRLHSIGIWHRDIKPENLILQFPESHFLDLSKASFHFIDWDRSKMYLRNSKPSFFENEQKEKQKQVQEQGQQSERDQQEKIPNVFEKRKRQKIGNKTEETTKTDETTPNFFLGNRTAIVGTFDFCSPEIIQHYINSDSLLENGGDLPQMIDENKADVWALGMSWLILRLENYLSFKQTSKGMKNFLMQLSAFIRPEHEHLDAPFQQTLLTNYLRQGNKPKIREIRRYICDRPLLSAALLWNVSKRPTSFELGQLFAFESCPISPVLTVVSSFLETKNDLNAILQLQQQLWSKEQDQIYIIQKKDRHDLINNLAKLCFCYFLLRFPIWCFTVELFDRCLASALSFEPPLSKKNLQDCGLACFVLASEICCEEGSVVQWMELQNIFPTHSMYGVKVMRKMILKQFKYQIWQPTVFTYLISLLELQKDEKQSTILPGKKEDEKILTQTQNQIQIDKSKSVKESQISLSIPYATPYVKHLLLTCQFPQFPQSKTRLTNEIGDKLQKYNTCCFWLFDKIQNGDYLKGAMETARECLRLTQI